MPNDHANESTITYTPPVDLYAWTLSVHLCTGRLLIRHLNTYGYTHTHHTDYIPLSPARTQAYVYVYQRASVSKLHSFMIYFQAI